MCPRRHGKTMPATAGGKALPREITHLVSVRDERQNQLPASIALVMDLTDSVAPDEFRGMLPILSEIDGCLTSGHYFAALTLALTLPDVCVSLGSGPDGPTVKAGKVSQLYKQWCSDNLDESASLDPELCWDLRNGAVHEATLRLKGYQQIVFSTPDSRISVHGVSVVSGAITVLHMDIAQCCHALVTAAQRWLHAQRRDPIVESGLRRMVRRVEYAFPLVSGGFVDAYVSITDPA
ncbi:MAG: hypothetical protein IT472_08870 [Thermomonas sp.]|uniref:hypothetical protein n=1 Tax=Thermomonas sp. TaxID=1971895 RepID=UPI0026249D33|nr:hypothetical protein [Thermomonas sp.]MCC7097277.1 hypothetical protein [Thermomonas sp.]